MSLAILFLVLASPVVAITAIIVVAGLSDKVRAIERRMDDFSPINTNIRRDP